MSSLVLQLYRFPLQPVEKNLLVSDPGLDEFKEQLFN